jgi:hypothetical protein
MVTKSQIALSFIIISLAFISGTAVIGVLQSNEKLSTSGIVIRPALPLAPTSPPAFPSWPSFPPPEPDIEIDVYSDSGCTKPVSNVDWGEIAAGSTINRIVYVENNGDYEVTLGLSTENWSPFEAIADITLDWDYDGVYLEIGEVRRVIFSLSVDSDIGSISSFSFDIVVTGSA